MSHFDKAGLMRDGERMILLGPEIINGTGEVYLNAARIPVLTNAQARELAAALVEAADFSAAVQKEEEERHTREPRLAEDFTWTDPAWRAAVRPPIPSDKEGGE